MDSGADEHADCGVLCENLSFFLNLKQKKTRLGGFLYSAGKALDRHYVCSRWAFGTVSDFKLNALTFSQGFETIALDCREVYEHVFATIFRSNEAKAF